MAGSTADSLYILPGEKLKNFTPENAIMSEGLITTTANHELTTGEYLFLGAVSPGPSDFSDLRRNYYAIVVSPTTFRIATNKENALAGIHLAFTGTDSVFRLSSVQTITGSFHGKIGAVIYPASADSKTTFSSDIPVQIDFEGVPYETELAELLLTNALPGPINWHCFGVCLFQQVGNTNTWGLGYCKAVGQPDTFLVTDGRPEGGINFGARISSSDKRATGWRQRYIIRETRRIEMWIAGMTGEYTLLYTSSVLPINTLLKLRVGAALDFVSFKNCTIKYL